jgi:hypothetical protein
VAACVGVAVVGLVALGALTEDDASGPPRAARATARPAATATATLTAVQFKAQYPALADVREIVARLGDHKGEKMSFGGTLLSIHVAGKGRIYEIGDGDDHDVRAQMQVTVDTPVGGTETIFVGYDGDTAGMFEDTEVIVYGTLVGTETFENAFGGKISQPLVIADLVEKAAAGSPSL